MPALYPIRPSACRVLPAVTYRRAMTCRLAAALVAAAGLAAPAAAAAAPVLSPLKPCYVADVDETTGYYDTEDVHVTGSGFTPNALVLIAIDGAQAAGDVPVDANGMLD